MNQTLVHHLQWTLYSSIPLYSNSNSNSHSLSFPFLFIKPNLMTPISSTQNPSILHHHTTSDDDDDGDGQQASSKLAGRERRKLRNERREKNCYDWKDDVEMKLIKKPKKRYASWTDELNLDNLSLLGPQWWVLRVSRVSGLDTSLRLARSLANNFPHIDFKVYIPSVQEKRKLKSGSFSVKSKSLFPGCAFLKCVLNKEIHDFIREFDGIGGFIGSKVGNTKRQINKPRPVSEDDMEAIFRQAKEEQEKADKAFEDEHKGVLDMESLTLIPHAGNTETPVDTKPKEQPRKASQTTSKEIKNKLPKKGATVKVLSGAFAEFSGTLKKLDRKNGKATVGFTLFGKETIADVDMNDIVEKTE